MPATNETVGRLGATKFDFKKGKKGDDDLVLLVKTDDWEQVVFKDLLTMIKFFFDNEDRIYRPPAKGSLFLLEAISDLRKLPLDDVLLKYSLRSPKLWERM